MTIEFDFESEQKFYGKASGISYTTGASYTTLCTVPLASADFPLQSGRAVYVDAEFVCIDSNGHSVALRKTATVALAGGLSGSGVNLVFNSGANDNSSYVAVGYFVLNGSNDLEVGWKNTNSGTTQDVSVRVKLRWFGS